MYATHTARRVLAAAAFAALWLGAPPARGAPDGEDTGDGADTEATATRGTVWAVDAAGRRFRVGFDSGTRWLVGGAWGGGFTGAGDGSAAAGAVETGILYRHRMPYPEEDVVWKLYHEVLATRLWLGGLEGADGVPLLSSVLYRGTFVRWQRDGFVTLPTSPPRRLEFPVNIGFDATVGRFETLAPGTDAVAMIGVVRSEVLFDFWRVPRLGSYAQVGIGPAYDVVLYGDWAAPSAAHVVTPGSGASFTVHHEWANGRQLVEARVEGAWRWSSGGGKGGGGKGDAGWGASAGARAGYEIVWLALNDQPVSAFVEASWRYDALLPAAAAHDVRALAGIRLGVTLD